MTKILIVCANFYSEISEDLITSASNVLKRNNSAYDIIKVPGSFEMPLTIKFAIESDVGYGYTGYIALGCVMRGETSHYDHICNATSSEIMKISVNYSVPIGFGIITSENMEQAKVRASCDGKDIGGNAARTTLEMIKIKNSFYKN